MEGLCSSSYFFWFRDLALVIWMMQISRIIKTGARVISWVFFWVGVLQKIGASL